MKGEVIWKRKYNKNSKRWTVYPYKKDKEYSYIPGLMNDIVEAYESKTKFTITCSDPKLLSPTIAPVPPPETKKLVADHISRFN